MLQECRRVLKLKGEMLVSFPPFYSLFLVGGHQFKPFHFLGEKLAVKLTNITKKTDFKNYTTFFGTFGLHPLKIDQVKEIILNVDFKILDIYTRMSKINTAHLPGFLKDLMTWHVCYLVMKPNGSG